jgi:hypothetical protein
LIPKTDAHRQQVAVANSNTKTRMKNPKPRTRTAVLLREHDGADLVGDQANVPRLDDGNAASISADLLPLRIHRSAVLISGLGFSASQISRARFRVQFGQQTIIQRVGFPFGTTLSRLLMSPNTMAWVGQAADRRSGFHRRELAVFFSASIFAH